MSVNYSGESSASNGGDPLFDLPSFTNVDASIGLGRADGAWLVQLWSYNLLNEYQPLSAGSTCSGDSISRCVQMPRTYGISFKYSL